MPSYPLLRDVLKRAWDKDVHDAAVLEHASSWKGTTGVVSVAADLEGWPKPPALGGFIPDVFVKTVDGWQLAIEVETTESISTTHTEEQLTAFHAWASAAPMRRFNLELVPKAK